jgi:hypothetical protein
VIQEGLYFHRVMGSSKLASRIAVMTNPVMMGILADAMAHSAAACGAIIQQNGWWISATPAVRAHASPAALASRFKLIGKSVDFTPEQLFLRRLKRARAAISYAILLDGPVYAPVLDRLEREIAAMRTNEDVVARARQYFERFRD